MEQWLEVASPSVIFTEEQEMGCQIYRTNPLVDA